MVKNFEEFQQFGKEGFETSLKSLNAVTQAAQAIAVEAADYSKKAFEDGSQTFEKLLGAKSWDKVVEVQSAYVKNAYEGFVAGATRFGDLYANLAKETYKPYEQYLAKTAAK
ncbi:MAG: phasin family protein [Pseudorhodoplanes sp.]